MFLKCWIEYFIFMNSQLRLIELKEAFSSEHLLWKNRRHLLIFFKYEKYLWRNTWQTLVHSRGKQQLSPAAKIVKMAGIFPRKPGIRSGKNNRQRWKESFESSREWKQSFFSELATRWPRTKKTAWSKK